MSTKAERRVENNKRKQRVHKAIAEQKMKLPKSSDKFLHFMNNFTLPADYNLGDYSTSQWGVAERYLFAYDAKTTSIPYLGKHTEKAKKDLDGVQGLWESIDDFLSGTNMYRTTERIFRNGSVMSMFFVGVREHSFEGQIETLRRAPQAKQQAPANPLIVTGTRTRKPAVAHAGMVTGPSLEDMLGGVEIASEDDDSGDHEDEDEDKEADKPVKTHKRDGSGSSFKSTMSVDSVAMARREVDEVVTSSVFITFLNGLQAVVGSFMGYTIINTLNPITFVTETAFGTPFKSKSDGAVLLHKSNGDKVEKTRSTKLNIPRIVEAKAARENPREQQFGEMLSAMNRTLLILERNGFTARNWDDLHASQPELFRVYIDCINQMDWQLKYVDFPPAYLRMVFGTHKVSGGKNLLHFKVMLMECPIFHLYDPGHVRTILETQHALNMHHTELALWIRDAAPA